ncbi:MAG: hypothetical protein AAF296_05805 [Pseudomonadota bacterium]
MSTVSSQTVSAQEITLLPTLIAPLDQKEHIPPFVLNAAKLQARSQRPNLLVRRRRRFARRLVR